MRQRTIGRIESLLKVGKEHAIKSDVLMTATGHDRRTIQAIIAREREDGALICGCDNGYYLAANKQEAADYYRHGTAAAKKLLHTLRHIKRFADGIEGQQELDPEGAA